MRTFINYRRQDAMWPAHVIYKALVREFGADNVFIDSVIPGGERWRETLRDRIKRCEAFVAVIGPKWIDARDKDTGLRRLENDNDLVRWEIAEAVGVGIPIFPVLLDGTELPSLAQLPQDMRGLVEFQAADVRCEAHEDNIKGLIAAIEAQAASKEVQPVITDQEVGLSQDAKAYNDKAYNAAAKLLNYSKTRLIFGKGRYCELAALGAAGPDGIIDKHLVQRRRDFAKYLGVELRGPVANADWAIHAHGASLGENAPHPINLGKARVTRTPSGRGRAYDHYVLTFG